MLANNSSRLLKNKHSWNDIFGRILYYDFDLERMEEERILKFGDVIEGGTEYNLNYLGEGEAQIKFKDKGIYEELINKVEQIPIAIEINVPESDNKLYYFYKSFDYKRNFEEKTIDMIIVFESFVNMVEKNTYVEHTREYSYGDLPVDDNLQKQEPDDFNKVADVEKSFNVTMNLFYQMNLKLPSDRSRGDIHEYGTAKGLSRVVLGFSNMSFIGNDFSSTIFEDKKTLFDLRNGLQDEGIDLNLSNVQIPTVTLDSGLFTVIFDNIDSISVINNETRDKPILFDIVRDSATHKKAILMESDYLVYSSQFYTSLPGYQFKKKENLGSCQVPSEWKTNNQNAGEIGNYVAEKARELSRESEINDQTKLQIDFWDKIYFDDIFAGQVINISGYDFLDGSYLIKNITATVNQTYTEFIMDDLEKN